MYFRLVVRKNNHYIRVLEILGIVHYNVEMLQIMNERLYQVLKKTSFIRMFCPSTRIVLIVISQFNNANAAHLGRKNMSFTLGCMWVWALSGTKRRRVTIRFLKKIHPLVYVLHVCFVCLTFVLRFTIQVNKFSLVGTQPPLSTPSSGKRVVSNVNGSFDNIFLHITLSKTESDYL